MKYYIIDTVALARYLEDILPKKVDKIFEDAENGQCVLWLPHIVIGEFIYIALKGRLKVLDPITTIRETLTMINTESFIECIDLDMECWEKFLDIDIKELHDRMICSLAITRNVPVITNDEKIQENKDVKSIWK
ncbi:MAG: PIN domain-containing protein [Methanosarcinales archaeon]